jgi:hypothetical protein
MEYRIVRIPRPLAPDEQARANFWDFMQKLSMIVGLIAAIRSLND